jgi:hypothetical protein
MAFWVLQLCLCQRRDGRWGPAPPAPHISENARVSVPSSGEQKSVTTPQAARGWARPPCRHFKDQSCILPGSAFEVTAAFQTLARAHQYTGRRPRKIHPRSNMDRNTLSCAASYLSWAGDSHSQMPNDSSTDSHPLYASLVRCCHPAAATPSEPRRAATPPCPFVVTMVILVALARRRRSWFSTGCFRRSRLVSLFRCWRRRQLGWCLVPGGQGVRVVWCC